MYVLLIIAFLAALLLVLLNINIKLLVHYNEETQLECTLKYLFLRFVLLPQDEERKRKKELKQAKKQKKLEAQISELEKKLESKDAELAEQNDRYMRMLAEYDNFRKRTVKEKEAIYVDSVKDTVAELLPVIDNLNRAVDVFPDKDCEECKGVMMVLKQTEEIFSKLGVSEIKAVGEQFNPEFHNAVMHVEDESIDDNTVVEEFQKGYIYKDKVIRYSMVKVAN